MKVNMHIAKSWGFILGAAFVGLLGPISPAISVSYAVDEGPDAKINRQLPGSRTGVLNEITDDKTAKIDGVTYLVAPHAAVVTDSGKLVPRPAGWYKHLHFPIRVQYWTLTDSSGQPAIFQMVLFLTGSGKPAPRP